MSNELLILFSPTQIRSQANRIFERIKSGSGQFTYHPERWDEVIDLVEKTTRENYPSLNIPFHARYVHFLAGGRDRLSEKKNFFQALDPIERARTLFDLVITSVLLDAGAGPDWKYIEPDDKKSYSRSEGLGVASFYMFFDGAFSSSKKPLADGEGLKKLTNKILESAFQVSASNPLIGVDGRVALLNNLGKVISSNKSYFENSRPGNLVDYILKRYGKSIEAKELLLTVLQSLGEIWPGRLQWDGVNLGDVWHYPPFGSAKEIQALIPFHKLSQWLTYSLMQPLMEAGVEIRNIDEMTGLPEYRNGGLFIDTGLIQLKNPIDLSKEHEPQSELIIEWRALTVVLLDEVAKRLRVKMNLNQSNFPLVKVLEGGTWWAGRRAAKMKRADGTPPLNIKSDGTVF
ncbi:MAG: URC4/urg3 family protein [Bdellovibrio sp.]